MDIIIKRGNPSGGRSKTEEKLVKEGWGGTMTEEQTDKCKYLERLAKEETGADKSMFKQHHVAKVK